MLSGGVPALLAKFPRHCAERDTIYATYPTNEWDRAADVSAIFPTKFEECDKQTTFFFSGITTPRTLSAAKFVEHPSEVENLKIEKVQTKSVPDKHEIFGVSDHKIISAPEHEICSNHTYLKDFGGRPIS